MILLFPVFCLFFVVYVVWKIMNSKIVGVFYLGQLSVFILGSKYNILLFIIYFFFFILSI